MGSFATQIAGGQANLKTTGAGRSAVRAKESTLFSGYVYNAKISTVYIQVFDAAALPADGAVPTLPPIKCPTDTNASLDFWAGAKFATGVVIASSTTAGTLTITTADDCWIFATVR